MTKIQLIIWKAKRVHEYALFYALYMEYIKIPLVCVNIQRTRFRRHVN
jgi:hypothetical protein